MTTSAVRSPGGGYLINGHKCLISFGSWASHATLFARLIDDSGTDRGITAFLVPTSNPGWRPVSEAMTLGLRAIPQNDVIIDNLRLPAEALVGEEGSGDIVVQNAFAAGRWMLGVVALGAMKRCLQLSVRYAERRTVATGPLLGNGTVQRILSEAVAATETVEALTAFLCESLDQGLESPAELCLVCKAITSELAWRVIDASVQLMGARGFLDTTTVGRHFRDYRILRIFEGATEGITVYLGHTILKAPEKFLGRLAIYFPAFRFENCAATLTEMAEYRNAETAPQERHRIAAAAGNLACWTIATSALTTRLALGRSSLGAHSMDWCEEQLRRRMSEARSTVQSKEIFPSIAQLTKHIGAYEENIGNTEQTYKGDDNTLDPLLRRAT